MLEGTVSTRVIRSLIGAVSACGVDPAQLSSVAGLRPDELADDLIRLPTSICDELWALLPTAALGSAVTHGLVTSMPSGGLGLWTQLFGAGDSAMDGLRDACHYFQIIADPGPERLELIENGGLTTVRYTTRAEYEPPTLAVLQEFGLSLVADHLRRATPMPIVPVRAQFTHGPVRGRADLVGLLGTGNVEFRADANSLTFLTTDLTDPSRDRRPGLSEVLRRHAELTLLTSAPPTTWIGDFRNALAIALQDNGISLTTVAAMLALAPRTLQRRLAEHGTTWRAELDLARADTALRLLNDTALTTQSVAGRIGYRDARALRRAAQRWQGRSPSTIRDDGARSLRPLHRR